MPSTTKSLRRRNNGEEKLHMACVEWFNINYPFPDFIAFHVPNEGRHKPQYRAKLRKLGVRSGIPDLLICTPYFSSDMHGPGLAIEFKYGKNKLTDDQRLMLLLLEQQGWSCHVVYEYEEFTKIIISHYG